MNQKDRHKLCANCDGRIPLESGSCPYCTAEQASAASREDAIYRNQQSLQDSLTALYAPPYSINKNSNTEKGSSFMKQTDGFKDMSEKRFHSTAALGVPTIPINAQEEQQLDEKSSFWPLLLLSVGANLLMLGLLQLFFSDNGFLRLEWDSSYWFVYCLAAAPLVLLGFKKANLVK